jgi:hypothetical protein
MFLVRGVGLFNGFSGPNNAQIRKAKMLPQTIITL